MTSIPVFPAHYDIFWREWKLAKDSTAYNLSMAFKIQGNLKIDRLNKAVEHLINTNDSLRLYFQEENDQVSAHLHHPLESCPIEYIMLSTTTYDNSDELDKEINKTRNHRFNLCKPHLFRMKLIKIKHHEHVFILCFHHIIVDGISEDIIAKTIAEYYNESAITSKPLSLDYYLKLKRKTLLKMAPSALFWKKYCKQIESDANELLLIESDNKKRESAGKFLYFYINRSLSKKIERITAKHQSSLFCFLMTAYTTLLHRLSDARQLSICYGVNTRENEVKSAIGCFTNVIPMIVTIDGNFTFSSVLKSITSTRALQRKQQNYPFTEVTLELKQHQVNIEQLVRLALIETTIKTSALQLNELSTEALTQIDNDVIYDLRLEYEKQSHGIGFRLNYRCNVFDESIIHRFPELFRQVIELFVDAPQTQINTILLPNKQEQDKLLLAGNGTDKNFWQTDLLCCMLSKQSKRNSHKPALSFNGKIMTYLQLEERVNALATLLLSSKQENNHAVIPIVLERGIEQIIAMLAVMKSGAAYVPIEPDYPIKRILAILSDCKPEHIICTENQSANLNHAISGYQGEVKKIDVNIIQEPNLCTNFPTILPSDSAYILYTSGSTGEPKGVEVSHLSLMSFLLSMKSRLHAQDDDHFLTLTPFIFDISALEIYLPLMLGSCCFIPDNQFINDGEYLCDLMKKYSIRFAQTTPTKWQLLLDTGWKTNKNMTILCGGETFPESLIQAHRQAKQLFNLYGPTETTIWATACLLQKNHIRKHVPIGKPLDNVKVYILDQYMQLAPLGRAGELYIGGLCVAKGYFGKPQLTKERFLAAPSFITSTSSNTPVLYKTGDIAKWTTDGNLLYLGRNDQQVKYHGHRLELGAIESALMSHPAIRHAAVIFKSTAAKKQLIAYFTLHPIQHPVSEDELRHFLLQSLPSYAIPNHLVVLNDLPLTANGKIDRKELEQRLIANTESTNEICSKTQEIVKQIWMAELGIYHCTIHDNFYHLGGDSLISAKIAYQIEKKFHIDYFARFIFNYPTVFSLSAHIDQLLEQSLPTHTTPLRAYPLPLSSMQKRFLLLQQIATPGDSPYNIVSAWRLPKQVELLVLEKSIRLLINQHEILRTIYTVDNNLLTQSILDNYVFYLTPEPILSNQLPAIFKQEEHHRFDFYKSPPYRIRFLKTSKETVLLFNFHHAILDNRALCVVINELRSNYQLILNQPDYHPPIKKALQYADFACLEYRNTNNNLLEKGLLYWQKRLAGYQELEFHTMEDNDARRARSGDSLEFLIDEVAFNKLKAFCRDNELTVFTLLLSVYAMLLNRYTSQHDVIIGVPTDQRASATFETVIGCFVNTIPVRIDVSNNVSFIEFALQVKHVFLSDLDYQSVPLEHILEKLNEDKSGKRASLVNTALSITHKNEQPELTLDGCKCPCINILATTSKFELSFNFVERDDALIGIIEYQVSLYDQPNILRMSQHFMKLLHWFLDNPNQLIKEGSLLTKQEEQEILIQWNQTQHDFPHEKTVHQLFEEQAEKQPSSIAIVEDERSITYEVLNQKSSRLATLLISLKLEKNTLVPVLMPRSIDFIIAQLAALKAGAIFVPLSPQTPGERLKIIQKETRALIWLTNRDCLANLTSSLHALGQDTSYHLIVIDELNLDPSSETPIPTYPVVSSDDFAYAIYTSGSTGQPKLVGVKHKSLVNLIDWHIREYCLTNQDRASVVSAESFDALIFEIYPVLSAGACLYIADKKLIYHYANMALWLEKSNISLCFVPTAIANELLSNEILIKNKKLKYLLTAGDRLRTNFISHNNSFAVYNLYGLTETSICSTSTVMKTTKNQKSCIGKPISNCTAYILDVQMNPVPVNLLGELYIGGIGAETCFLNQGNLAQEKYVCSPFQPSNGETAQILYRTGDLVSWSADGSINFIGRLDNQVKLRGFRIELGEVEQVLLSHPEITEAVVILSSTNATPEKHLAAYYKTAIKTTLDPLSLVNFVKHKLPDYMVPHRFISIEQFPLTINGKIDKKYLENLPQNSKTPPTINNVTSRESIGKHSISFFILERALKELLGLDSIDPHVNFFDIGVHSLMLMQLIDKVHQVIKVEFLPSDFFEHTTLSQLSPVLESRIAKANLKLDLDPVYFVDKSALRDKDWHVASTNEIAVIAVACQFPGANNYHEFWANLLQSRETITRFTDEQLENSGVDYGVYNDLHYVKARGVIDDADCFDADFFNISPREALLMDPQQRLFLQQAWIALETAGYCPAKYLGKIAVFAGADESLYVEHVLKPRLGEHYQFNDFQVMIANATQTFLSTKTSYKLGLQGLSLNINTACSTGLAVVDLACQYLKLGHCDIALAGAVSIKQLQLAGYIHKKDSIFSPDGHCRAFDSQAAGTVPSGGVAVVVLKRLNEALKDGDCVMAVIKGSFLNNDGYQKAGFAAPSAHGQAACIEQALALANVPHESIGYIETHGTGTSLGDPIEIKALSTVFSKQRSNPCPIGSVKTNIGHADAAAGLAGFIKTVLMLKHKTIVPTLHYQENNPSIYFEKTPFFVATNVMPWNCYLDYPRRAGVSAFGIGGTNAHVILEESPLFYQATSLSSRQQQLIVLSAKTQSALTEQRNQFVHYLKNSPKNIVENEDNSKQFLANIAFTLQVGRSDFMERSAFSCETIAQAINSLEVSLKKEPSAPTTHKSRSGAPQLIFLFPGQGAQYPQMGRRLYETEPVFAACIDQCCDITTHYLGMDLKTILYPDTQDIHYANQLLQQTQFIQPALFCTEYALATLYQHWGVNPKALLGHSLGELVAAVIGGVFSIEDGLKLVCIRGRLMGDVSPGAMLTVLASVERLSSLLQEGVTIASINTPNSCSIAGNAVAIESFKRLLDAQAIPYKPINTLHAFHSDMMDKIIPVFVDEVRNVHLQSSSIPIISNLTGEWATDKQLTNPSYWGQHVRHTVQFSKGIETLQRSFDCSLFLECGPGTTLTNWVKQHQQLKQPRCVVSMLSGKLFKEKPAEENKTLPNALAFLWQEGANLDWASYNEDRPHKRLPLPAYPFEKRKYWPASHEDIIQHSSFIDQKSALSNSLYQPSWLRLDPLTSILQHGKSRLETDSFFIVFARKDTLSDSLLQQLETLDCQLIIVYQGNEFIEEKQQTYLINAQKPEHYTQLIKPLSKQIRTIYLMHLWGISDDFASCDNIEETLKNGLYSLTFITQALSTLEHLTSIRILLIQNYLHALLASDLISPAKAAVSGACQVIPLELESARLVTLDITHSNLEEDSITIADCLVHEVLTMEEPVSHLIYSGGYRWRRTVQLIKQTNEPLLSTDQGAIFKQEGAYLITGGLGGIGLAIASMICSTTTAHVALFSRTRIPPEDSWSNWLNDHTVDHPHFETIGQLQLLKKTHRASFSVWPVDISDYDAMCETVKQLEINHGSIAGIIHAAGIAGSGLIASKTANTIENVLRPKLAGTYTLSQIFKDKPLDFVLLCSSLTSITGGIGQLDYSAANAALDAVSHSGWFNKKTPIITINWNAWLEKGMYAKSHQLKPNLFHKNDIHQANTIYPAEGLAILNFALKYKPEHLLVSRYPIETIITKIQEHRISSLVHNACDVEVEPMLQSSDPQEGIKAIFQSILGIKRVSQHDDFFALGGDSLSALSLIEVIEKKYQVRIRLNQIYHVRTPAQLAEQIKSLSPTQQSPLVLLNRTGKEPPLFLIHPVGGTVFCYLPLARRLAQQRVFYALQDPSLTDSGHEFKTLKAMAACYLEAIKKIQPHGPYYLGGYSLGGTVAFEIAHQLIEQGETLNFLGLIDSWATFTDQFRDQGFFEDKMRSHLKESEEKLLSATQDITQWLNSQWQRMQLLLTYQPTPLPCKITLFKAAHKLPEYEAIDDHYNHWQRHSTVPVHCIETAGNHDTMMMESNITTLSYHLLNCLSMSEFKE